MLERGAESGEGAEERQLKEVLTVTAFAGIFSLAWLIVIAAAANFIGR